MNFYARWERVLIQRCIALFIWRAKTFMCCSTLKNGGYIIAVHTLANGLVLLSPVYEVLGHSEESCYPIIPNDARLIYALLGSSLIVLATVLFFGLVRIKLFMLINFAIGMEIILLIFPITFPFAYIRVYVQTSEYFKSLQNQLTLPEEVCTLKQNKYSVLGFLYIMLTYSVVTYFLYFYYVVIVLSFYDEITKANGLRKKVSGKGLRANSP